MNIGNVVGVGGKPQVLQRFQERSGTSGKAEFYLVDGDFDELLGRSCPDDVYFYRLGRYDIENYLLEEETICIIAEENSPGTTMAEHRALLKIPSWISQVVDRSTRLAACAALIQELGEGYPSIQSVDRFVPEKEVVPDPCKIEVFIAGVKANQATASHEAFDKLLDQMTVRMGTSSADRRRWVSGKHIFIPLVMKLLRQHTKSQQHRESLCFRLAKSCSFSELVELRDRILFAYRISSSTPDPSEAPHPC